MKVQHIIVVLSDGRKGLFTGKPFTSEQDEAAGVKVIGVEFTHTMEMKSGSIPVDVEEVVSSFQESNDEGEDSDRQDDGERKKAHHKRKKGT